MSDYRGIPVIRLSLEGMTHSIVKALSDYEMKLSEEMKRAVEAYCSEANIERVMRESVEQAADAAIRDTVVQYFRYGVGAKEIRRAVEEKLDAIFPPEEAARDAGP